MTSGGRKRSTLPYVPAGQHQQALLVAGLGERGGRLRVRLLGARSLTSSIAIIAPRPRTSPMMSYFSAIAVSRGLHDLLDALGPGVEVQLPHRLDGAERRGAGHRVAAVGAAEAAGVRGVHDLGAAGDGGQRQTARDALGGGDQVRDDALVLAGEPLAGAAEAGLDLVRDEDDAVVLRELRDGAAGSPWPAR